jgi:hypothetical protein
MASHRPPACPNCSVRPCKCDMIDAAILEAVNKADTEEHSSSSDDDFDLVHTSQYPPPAAIPIPVRVRVVPMSGSCWVSTSSQSG